MKYRTRFQEQKLSCEPGKTDYVFEIAWRRPERAMPPIDILKALDDRFCVKSFKLTSDNGR